MACDSMCIGYADEKNVYLFVDGDEIGILYTEALDYDVMRDYIDNTGEVEGDWRYDVEHGNTEDSLDSYRENYEYRYEDYFTYDSACDIYYDGNGSYEYNGWGSETDNLANEILDWIENDIGDITWDVTIDEFRAKVEEFADRVAEEKERQKYKYRVYAYYK